MFPELGVDWQVKILPHTYWKCQFETFQQRTHGVRRLQRLNDQVLADLSNCRHGRSGLLGWNRTNAHHAVIHTETIASNYFYPLVSSHVPRLCTIQRWVDQSGPNFTTTQQASVQYTFVLQVKTNYENLKWCSINITSLGGYNSHKTVLQLQLQLHVM